MNTTPDHFPRYFVDALVFIGVVMLFFADVAFSLGIFDHGWSW